MAEQQQAEMLQALQTMEQQLGISIDAHKKYGVLYTLEVRLARSNQSVSRMVYSCFRNCINPKYSDGLQVGEAACVDRCITKYMQATEIVMNHFKESEEKQLQFLKQQMESQNQSA